MHALLARQIEECLGDAQVVPESLQTLFDAISDTYDRCDEDRRTARKANEWKKAEEELRQAVALLTAALESTADGILIVDQDGHIKGYNKEFAAMWHLPRSIVESQDDEQTLCFMQDQLDDPETCEARVQGLSDTPAAESSDIIRLGDGRVFERYSKPQFIDSAIVGRVWSFRDVTERIQVDQQQTRLLEQLAKTNRELEKANQELNDFAYVVSHDLKAPLRGIKVLAGWIATDYVDKLDDEGKEQLQLLLSRVERMHDLIQGILQYSRVGRVKEDIVEVDLNRLVPNIVDMLAPAEHICVTIQRDLPVIVCERTKTTQVFQNLLSNAIKYMDKPQGRIDVSCEEETDFWQFRIADNGPGIELKYFEKIFQMFQTLSPRDEFESTGIGLTLVKKIIEMCGGCISVESQLNAGTTFVFTLPKTEKGVGDAQLQARASC